MSERPRVAVAECLPSALPARPGVYSIWRDGEPIYVGKAGSLSSRLGKAHRWRGRSLKNSALRRNVAEFLEIAPANEIKNGSRLGSSDCGGLKVRGVAISSNVSI